MGLGFLATSLAAIDSHNTMKDMRKEQREANARAEAEKQEQEQKQKDLQNTYKNMKTNLYSGDANGIQSNQLIQ